MEERFEVPGSVRFLKAVLPVTVRDDLTVELPARVRWSLSLNEGEILAVDREDWGQAAERYRFRGYGPGGASQKKGRPFRAAFPGTKRERLGTRR